MINATLFVVYLITLGLLVRAERRLKKCKAEREAVTLGFRVTYQDPFRVLEGGDKMAIVLTDVQKVVLSIQPVDAAGNPAPVEGAPLWSSSDPTVLTVTPAVDGMSAEAVTVGPLGTAQVTVEADADLGTGIKTITGVLDVTVMASEAVSLSIAAGTPEPRL